MVGMGPRAGANGEYGILACDTRYAFNQARFRVARGMGRGGGARGRGCARGGTACLFPMVTYVSKMSTNFLALEQQ